MQIAGIFCALWTPTDTNGEVLWNAFDKNLDFVLRAGVDGIMALGSTAEFPHFQLQLRRRILERICAACSKRYLPVIANVSHVNCQRAIDLAWHAKDSGAVLAAVLPPWFFPTDQRDLAEFFIRLGREAKMPLGLYNYPEVCGKRIELDTIRRVASEINVAVVKQSGADFDYTRELTSLGVELGFNVLTGTETRLAEAMRLGCKGTVSGLANVAPDVLAAAYALLRQNQDATPHATFLNGMVERMAPLPFPLNVKAAMAARNIETGEAKNPISGETRSTYREVLNSLRAFYAENASLLTANL